MRIKLLRNKPDHALVQMGDGFQAELAVHFLKVRIVKTWIFFITVFMKIFGSQKKLFVGFLIGLLKRG